MSYNQSNRQMNCGLIDGVPEAASSQQHFYRNDRTSGDPMRNEWARRQPTKQQHRTPTDISGPPNKVRRVARGDTAGSYNNFSRKKSGENNNNYSYHINANGNYVDTNGNYGNGNINSRRRDKSLSSSHYSCSCSNKGGEDSVFIYIVNSNNGYYRLVKEDVERLCKCFGPIQSVVIEEPFDVAKVHFTDSKSVEEAIQALDDTKLPKGYGILKVVLNDNKHGRYDEAGAPSHQAVQTLKHLASLLHQHATDKQQSSGTMNTFSSNGGRQIDDTYTNSSSVQQFRRSNNNNICSSATQNTFHRKSPNEKRHGGGPSPTFSSKEEDNKNSSVQHTATNAYRVENRHFENRVIENHRLENRLESDTICETAELAPGEKYFCRLELIDVFGHEPKFNVTKQILGENSSNIYYILESAQRAVDISLKGRPQNEASVAERLHLVIVTGDKKAYKTALEVSEDLLTSVCTEFVSYCERNGFHVPLTCTFRRHEYRSLSNGHLEYLGCLDKPQTWLKKYIGNGESSNKNLYVSQQEGNISLPSTFHHRNNTSNIRTHSTAKQHAETSPRSRKSGNHQDRSRHYPERRSKYNNSSSTRDRGTISNQQRERGGLHDRKYEGNNNSTRQRNQC